MLGAGGEERHVLWIELAPQRAFIRIHAEQLVALLFPELGVDDGLELGVLLGRKRCQRLWRRVREQSPDLVDVLGHAVGLALIVFASSSTSNAAWNCASVYAIGSSQK